MREHESGLPLSVPQTLRRVTLKQKGAAAVDTLKKLVGLVAVVALAGLAWAVFLFTTGLVSAAQRFYLARRGVLEDMTLYTLAALAVFVIVGAMLAVLWAASHVYRAWRDAHLVHPDDRGLLPVPRAHVEAGAYGDTAAAALGAYHHTQATSAAMPRFSGQARSERINVYNGSTSVAQPAASVQPDIRVERATHTLPGPVELHRALPAAPSLDRLLIAQTENGPVTVAAPDLVHVALVGNTGGGKSNLLRLLIAQIIAAGGQVMLIDPHYTPVDVKDRRAGDWRPIEAGLIAPPAYETPHIAAVFSQVEDELDSRLRRRRGGWSGEPQFIAIDELPVIAQSVPDGLRVLTRVLREGRKVDLFAVAAAQDLLVKTLGTGGAVRDNFRTAYYLGGDTHSAAVLLDMPRRDITQAETQLRTGVALLRSKATPQARLVAVPYATDAAIYGLLPGPRAPQVVDVPTVEADDPRQTWQVVGGGKGVGVGGGGSFEAQNGPETVQTTPTTPTTPTPRPVRVSLTEQARALDGMEFTDQDWRALDLLDQGKTAQQVANILADNPGYRGGRYTRLVREVETLRTMVENLYNTDAGANTGD